MGMTRVLLKCMIIGSTITFPPGGKAIALSDRIDGMLQHHTSLLQVAQSKLHMGTDRVFDTVRPQGRIARHGRRPAHQVVPVYGACTEGTVIN